MQPGKHSVADWYISLITCETLSTQGKRRARFWSCPHSQSWALGATCPYPHCIAQPSAFVSAKPICPPLPNHFAAYIQGLCWVCILFWMCSRGLPVPSHGRGWATKCFSLSGPDVPHRTHSQLGADLSSHLSPLSVEPGKVRGLQEVPDGDK